MIRPAFAVAGLLLALVLMVATGFGSSGPPGAAMWPPAALSWSDGTVLCNFNTTHPLVAVSALGLAASGLSSGLSGVSEVDPAGATVAAASISGAGWMLVNDSTPDEFSLGYRSHVLLVSSGGSTAPVGWADLGVEYSLAAYDDSAAGNLSTVAAVFQVSNWTWQHSGDALLLSIPLWPTFAAAEHLGMTSPTGFEITSSSNATGTPREYFRLSDTATATPASGIPRTVAATSQVGLSPSFASVSVTIGPGAGNYTSVTYTAQVSVSLPSAPAGVPLSDYAIVGGGAVALSVAVAVGTRRLRRRPPGFAYVEEER